MKHRNTRNTFERLKRRAFEKKRSDKYRENIKETYPEFLDELILYLNAGVMMEDAIRMAQLAHSEESDFYHALHEIVGHENDVRQTIEFGFHEWARKLGIPEIMRFSGILSDVLKKGVDPVPKLELEAALVRQMKTRTIEKKGQTAETKLVFPMALLLAALLILTIAPVFLEMQL